MTYEELQTLPFKRLKAFHRAEQKRSHKANRFCCDLKCYQDFPSKEAELNWDVLNKRAKFVCAIYNERKLIEGI